MDNQLEHETEGDQPRKTQQQTLQMQRRQRRVDLYEKVVQLHQEGHSQRAISQALQIQRKTVRRWLRAGQFPERKPPVRKPPKVQAFAEYLQQRWNEGCHNATKLFQEIRSRGYRGQRSMVARFVSSWRASRWTHLPATPRRITPRHAAVLTTRAPDELTQEQRLLLDQLSFTCSDLQWIRTLALDFRAALSSGNGQQMLDWIQIAKLSGIGSLVRFAFGLQKDVTAVCASVQSPWSNGQVEGQINRLKMIKRQMYGRAGLPLLRARVLPYRSLATSAALRAP
jgi:transposase